jgi:hypothetical protein
MTENLPIGKIWASQEESVVCSYCGEELLLCDRCERDVFGKNNVCEDILHQDGGGNSQNLHFCNDCAHDIIKQDVMK